MYSLQICQNIVSVNNDIQNYYTIVSAILLFLFSSGSRADITIKLPKDSNKSTEVGPKTIETMI